MSKKYVIFSSKFNDSSWNGKFDSSILLNIQFMNVPESTGLLADTLWVDKHIFCDVVNSKFVLKKEFEDTQMLNSTNNGSFNIYSNYSPDIFKKLKKAVEAAGYIIVDNVETTLFTELNKMKNYTPNEYDFLMTYIFNKI